MGWSGKRVLVTGGEGFLGSALAWSLLARGAEVTVLDNRSPEGGANAANLEGAALVSLPRDLRTDDLTDAVAGQAVIFNLAARTGHEAGQREPLDDLDVNARAQLRLIAAVNASGASPLIVHASTRQVYGRVDVQPVTEAQPPSPPDANAVSKLAGELYWLMEHRLGRLPVVCLRLTNCYGPRQRIRDAAQSFLGHWIGRALSGEAFEVWGGDQLRDFCFVEDAVEALIAAAEEEACLGQVFNIGGGSAAKLRDVAELVARITGATFSVLDLPEGRVGIDMGDFRACDAAFRELTPWRAKVALEPGLIQTIRWFEPRRNAYLHP